MSSNPKLAILPHAQSTCIVPSLSFDRFQGPILRIRSRAEIHTCSKLTISMSSVLTQTKLAQPTFPLQATVFTDAPNMSDVVLAQIRSSLFGECARASRGPVFAQESAQPPRDGNA